MWDCNLACLTRLSFFVRFTLDSPFLREKIFICINLAKIGKNDEFTGGYRAVCYDNNENFFKIFAIIFSVRQNWRPIMGKRGFLIFLVLAITVRLNLVVSGAKRATTSRSTRINQFWQIGDRRMQESQNLQNRQKIQNGPKVLQRPVSFVKEPILKDAKIDKTEPIGKRGNSLPLPSKLRSRESRREFFRIYLNHKPM